MRVRIAVIAIITALVLVAGALQWRPILRAVAQTRLAASTGCAVRVAGPVDLSPSMAPEIRLAGIAFTAREGGSASCRGKLAELEMFFRLWGLRFERLEARHGEVPLGTGERAPALVVDTLVLTPGATPDTVAAELSGRLEYAPLTLPLEATALLDTSGHLGVSDLDLQLGERAGAWLEVAGHAARLAPPEAFELSARFGWTDVQALAPLVGDPPDLGPVEGSMLLHDRTGVFGVYDFTLKGGRPGVFEIDAEGRFEELPNLHGLDVRLDLKARDLAVLGELLRTPLPTAGPVVFSGSLAAQERRFSADEVVLHVGDSRVSGTFSAHLPEHDRPRFEARLDAKPLHLAHLGVEPRDTGKDGAPSAPDSWSDEPFDLDGLRGFDAKFVARAEDVRGVNGPLLDEMSFEGELERGRLSLRHLSVAVDGGRVTGELHADLSVNPPAFSFEADARRIEMSQLLEQIERSNAYSGVLHGRLELESQGASPRALAGNLSGEFTAASPGGRIATAHASLLTKDFFSVLRPSQQRVSEVLNCLVVDLGFAAGVGTVRAWVLDTEDLVVIGEGRIDVGARRFDLRFLPKPRDPSPLSTAATIRLTGPLSAPTVSTEKSSLFASTTKALLGTVPWLSRSREGLRRLVGAGEHFGRCQEILDPSF